MAPTPQLNSPQQLRQHDGSSSQFRDQSSDHNGGEISTLSTTQRVLVDIADPTSPGPPTPPNSSIHADLNSPGWKRLICRPPTTRERISLIATIFSDRDEVEMARRLCKEDAQAPVDVIYVARSHYLSSLENGSTDFDLNSAPTRHWVPSITHCR